jgi:hypothetical protein
MKTDPEDKETSFTEEQLELLELALNKVLNEQHLKDYGVPMVQEVAEA